MDNQDRPGSQYDLDTETGETLTIPEEIMRALDEGESCEDLPAWKLELVEPAKEILADRALATWKFRYDMVVMPTG